MDKRICFVLFVCFLCATDARFIELVCGELRNPEKSTMMLNLDHIIVFGSSPPDDPGKTVLMTAYSYPSGIGGLECNIDYHDLRQMVMGTEKSTVIDFPQDFDLTVNEVTSKPKEVALHFRRT